MTQVLQGPAPAGGLAVEPVISYPSVMEPGNDYLFSVDLRALESACGWPAAAGEEYAVHCLVNGAPFFRSEPLGGGAVVVHRFGGTYGPARFLLRPTRAAGEGVIRVTLVNAWGVPLATLETPPIPIRPGGVFASAPRMSPVPARVLPARRPPVDASAAPEPAANPSPAAIPYSAATTVREIRLPDRFYLPRVDLDGHEVHDVMPWEGAVHYATDGLRVGVAFPDGRVVWLGNAPDPSPNDAPDLRQDFDGVSLDALSAGLRAYVERHPILSSVWREDLERLDSLRAEEQRSGIEEPEAAAGRGGDAGSPASAHDDAKEAPAEPLRVYISSTELDSAPYCELAAQVCRRLGFVPRKMEEWGTFYGHALQQTFDEIEKAGLMVCIVGRHYGGSQPGQTYAPFEQEFDHAEGAGIPIIAFMLEEERSRSYPADRELLPFLDKVRAHTVFKGVGSEREFEVQLTEALSRWSLRHPSNDAGHRSAGRSMRRLQRLFLSYNVSERVFAQRLHRDLRRDGYDVWMQLLEPETTRTAAHDHQVRAAIAAADGVIFVWGSPPRSHNFMEVEIHLARAAGKPLFAVLPGSTRVDRDRSLDLARVPAVEFGAGALYDLGFSELLQLLERQLAKMPGTLQDVPVLPEEYVAREDELAALRSILFGDPAWMALCGVEGVGKSVLAAALARDEAVQLHFPDGVIWVPIWTFKNEAGVRTYISHSLGRAESLASRRLLLILDGAEDGSLVWPFIESCKGSGILVTTRNRALAYSSSRRFEVSPLSRAQALELLARAASVRGDQLPEEASKLAERAAFLPALLVKVGAFVRGGGAWSDGMSVLGHTREDVEAASSITEPEFVRPARASGGDEYVPGPQGSSGLSRFIGEHIVRDRDAHDLSRNPEFSHFQFIGFHVSSRAVDVVALCDADELSEAGIIRLRDEFFEIVRRVPHEYGLKPRGRNPNGLLGFVFAGGCSLEMARFISRQTRISHDAGTGGVMVSWAFDIAAGRIHTHENPVSILPPVMILTSQVYPGLEYFKLLVTRATEGVSAIEEDPPLSGGPVFRARPAFRVTARTLNMRASPGTEHRVVKQLLRGTWLESLEESGRWMRVKTADGDVGWVSARYLEPDTGLPPTASELLRVTAITLNMRDAPGAESPIVAKLAEGTRLTKLEESNGWMKVKTAGGQEGWVSATYVMHESAPLPTSVGGGISIHIGVDAPAGMRGHSLSQSENGARRMAELASQAGYGTTHVLCGAAATREAVGAQLVNAARTLRAGQTLFVSFCGHSSRVRDKDVGGWDEAWSLYDGEMLDDHLTGYLRLLEPGTRALVVIDSSYSGGMVRGKEGAMARADSPDPAPERLAYLPTDRDASRDVKQFAQPEAPFIVPPVHDNGIRASVLMLTASTESQAAREGLFTSHLLATWDGGTFRGSLVDLYRRVRERVLRETPTQEPQILMLGAADPSFPLEVAFHLDQPVMR
jgi:SH3-like domain-containing protein